MKHKDDDFKIFKEFKDLVENKIGKKIKIFRSENSGVCISNKFIEFCKKENSVPYNLEQNGVAERLGLVQNLPKTCVGILNCPIFYHISIKINLFFISLKDPSFLQ